VIVVWNRSRRRAEIRFEARVRRRFAAAGFERAELGLEFDREFRVRAE